MKYLNYWFQPFRKQKSQYFINSPRNVDQQWYIPPRQVPARDAPDGCEV